VLIRWRHKKKGYIQPGLFIPIVESTNAILDLGEYIIRETIKFLYDRKTMGRPLVKLAINVSQRQLKSQDLVKIFSELLAFYKVDTKYVEVEITESAIMEDEGIVLNKINKLKEMGITISLDDFGTGYSSLSFLKVLPIDKLKIDKAFIDNYKSRRDLLILKNIFVLAHSLKFQTVMEGVETKEQLKLVRLLNCYEVQGYLVSKPINKRDFNHFLQNFSIEKIT